ncbi:Glycoside hydrolase family 76 protein [Mycena indigotica]|uniref:Glycoside hydrolase family 76 protein n=1 Tax=Mycena indigotica TaxID=2126181 RepID=A0A8H6RWS9_9AGAR|nr:Glycoside hydrolase family 76 protein [Mycena indigotica]KAF7288754.1 Glycoside hydrolase family 76 protein [Mycena indigotica]
MAPQFTEAEYNHLARGPGSARPRGHLAGHLRAGQHNLDVSRSRFVFPRVPALSLSEGLISSLVDTYGFSGALYSLLAEFDQLTNRSQYAVDLVGYFGAASVVTAVNYSGLYVLNNGLNFGHGAVVAYKTYNNSLFLQFAVDAWSAVVPYTLTQAELDAGKTSNKNFTLSSDCQAVSMAGGTFWSTDPADPQLVVLATGSFFVLSALLAEATADPKYLSAAVQAVSFIRSHLCNNGDVVLDGLSVNTNDKCALNTAGRLPYNSGLVIEGLAVLYSISRNTTYRDMLDDLITASLTTTVWQNDTGIIQWGPTKNGDGSIPRGLVAAHLRNAMSPSLTPSILAYLAVQYNAVADLAKQIGGHIYSASWIGPPGTTFDAGSQINAIQALISSLALDNTVSSSTSFSFSLAPAPTVTSSVSPRARPSSEKAKQSVGGIVGIVLGALVVLTSMCALLLCWSRKRRDKRLMTPFVEAPSSALQVDMRDHDRHRPAPHNSKQRGGMAQDSNLPVKRASSSKVWTGPPPTLAQVNGAGRQAAPSFTPDQGVLGVASEERTREELTGILSSRMSGGSAGGFRGDLTRISYRVWRMNRCYCFVGGATWTICGNDSAVE